MDVFHGLKCIVCAIMAGMILLPGQLARTEETGETTAQDLAQQPPPSSGAGTKGSSSSKPTNMFSESLFETSEGQPPLFIKSNTLKLDTKSRTFTYVGNVEVVRAELTVTADEMVGHYDENNRIKTITCNKNVVITKGQEMRASSDRAIYNVSKGTIELTEGPELINKGNALTAEKVTVFVDEDRSEAEGDVRVRVIKTAETSESKEGALLDSLASSSAAPSPGGRP